MPSQQQAYVHVYMDIMHKKHMHINMHINMDLSFCFYRSSRNAYLCTSVSFVRSILAEFEALNLHQSDRHTRLSAVSHQSI